MLQSTTEASDVNNSHMASTSTSQHATWHEGDTCLAQDPKDGILREATISRLSASSSDNPVTAWLTFRDHGAAAVEEPVPVSKLQKPASHSTSQEKPFFSGTVINSNASVSLILSHEDKVPYTINRYLRDYQREGIKFMYNNYIQSRGCILGDDMGLGKTVQVIGLLAALLQKKGTWEDIENNRPSFLQSQSGQKQIRRNKVFLIVAPLSVLYNWKDELETWGHFQCVVIHGLKKDEELNRIKKGRIEIALTTYETLRLCLDRFNDIDWSAVIVDEAHKIKNPNSQITQAMKQLDCQIRIGLTGTILQNNLEELWCVMDWAVPKCLRSSGNFKSKYSEPIEQGQKHNATKRALATGRKAVRALVKRISHYFLRRTKALIKDQLPKKDDRVVYCSLTDFQQTVYKTVLDSEDVTLMLRSADKCDCGSGQTRRRCCYKVNSAGVEMKTLYFTYLAILRKIANHVALLQSSSGTSKRQKDCVGVICQKVFEQCPEFVQRCKHEAFEALSDPTYSGKMKVLQKLLHFYRQRKDKILLFSLSTKLLDVLESYCMAEGLDYSRLDGNTKSKERVQIVKEFNSSSHINICLVSTMAGGLGLNFVGANVVVLFDPTWNPANDLQAIDRAYRIGQCRDVTVLRLISLGTVEEVIYLRQVYKQQLHSSVVAVESARRYFEAVQGDDAQKGELFGLKNLFRLQTQGTCLTRQILEREGRVEAGLTTTRTHMGDEKDEEEKERDEPHKDPTTAASNNNPALVKSRGASRPQRRVLDFSSGSEDEEGMSTKKSSDPDNADTASTPGRTTLMQYGFCKLLQRIKGSPDSEDGDSTNKDRTSDDDNNQQSPSNVSNFTTVKDSKFHILSDSELEENVASKKDVTNKRYKRRFVANITATMSDESEDLDFGVTTSDRNKALKRGKSRRKQAPSKVRFTEEIETFSSSSDDERTSVKPRPKRRRIISPVKQCITSKQSGRVTLEEQGKTSKLSQSPQAKNRTIDSVLGGVQEVAYTHSNQKVVGGSRAEARISRAAVRDVFQRNLFSQMPANHLLGTQESSSESSPDSPPDHRRVQGPVQSPSPEHPVQFTTRSTERTRHTTFIIGETPQSICRTQMQEMATQLQFSSVEQFAAEILRSTSNQRLSWLQRYYRSLDHPGLSDTITKHFPAPVSAKPASAKPASAKPESAMPESAKPGSAKLVSAKLVSSTKVTYKETTKETTKTLSNHSPSKRATRQEVHEKRKRKDPFENIPSPEADWPEEKVEITSGFIKKRRGEKDESFLNPTRAEALRRDPQMSPDSPPAPATKNEQTCPKPSQEPKTEQETNEKSYLTDLIGDTSILDDLFKPKRNSKRSSSSENFDHSSSSKKQETSLCEGRSPKTAFKKVSKDFWDVLQEEESLNRLTDPAEVQRVCVNTNIAATHRHKQEESRSLWKPNDKFLWKR